MTEKKQPSMLPSEAELIKADVDGLKTSIKAMEQNQKALIEQLNGIAQGLNSQPAPIPTPAQALSVSAGALQSPQPLINPMNDLVGLMKGFLDIQNKMKEGVYSDLKAASEGIFGEPPEEDEEESPLETAIAPMIQKFLEGQQPPAGNQPPLPTPSANIAPEPPPIPSVKFSDIAKQKGVKPNSGTAGGENNAGTTESTK